MVTTKKGQEQEEQRPKTPAEALPLPGKIAGRYQVKRLIGSGGFGLVYEAEDEVDQRLVALKVIRAPEIVSGSASDRSPASVSKRGTTSVRTASATDRRFADGLRDEFRILAQLHHSNLAAVYDFGRSPEVDGVYFTQELIEGSYMREVMHEADHATIVDLFLQLARALDYLHALGFLHEDITPKNVLVSKPEVGGGVGRAKLIDFGLARLLRRTNQPSAMTPEGTALGTPGFSAPERVQGQATDARSDLYSLGATIYASAIGRAPFPTRDFKTALAAQLEWRKELAGALLDRCGPVVAGLVGRMLEPEPEQRPQSARSIVLELLGRESGNIVRARQPEQDLQDFAQLLVQHLPFVDRSGLLARMLDRAIPLLRGESRSPDAPTIPARPVVVRAPEGMGKKRLCAELRREVQLVGGLFAAGSCWSDEGSALGPFGPVVTQIAAGLGDASEVVDRHGDLVRLARDPQGDGAAAGRLLDFLIEGAAERPYVLYLEDLDKAQESTREVVERIVRAVADGGSGVLLCTTTAPSDKVNRFLTPLGNEKLLDVWTLPPFTREELTIVIRGVFGAIPALSELVNMLETLTGGHPFAVKETLKVLIEERILVRNVEGWSLRTSSRVIAELQQLLAKRVESRLDRVGVGAWEVGTILFLFGAPVEEDKLAELTDLRRERFTRLLTRLEGEGLVTRSVAAGTRKLALAHESVREAVRRRSQDSLDETRIELASRVEELGTDDPSLVFLRGELLDDAAEGLEAIDALEEAAALLLDRGQHRLGARLLDRVIGRLRKHGAVDSLPRILRTSLTLLERAAGSLENSLHEEDHYRAGILAAQLLRDRRAEVLLWLALANRFSVGGENTEVTLERLEHAADAARASGDPALELRVAGRRAEALVQAGFVDEADEHSERAMKILELPAPDDVDVCHIIGVRIRTLSFAGRFEEAGKLHEIGRPVAARVPVPHRQTYLSGLAFLCLLGGDYERGVAELSQAVEEIRASDTPRLLFSPLHNLGDLHLRLGNLESAAEAFREVLRLSMIFGLEHQRHLNRGFLGYTLARLGDVEEGAQLLARARADAQRSMGAHVTVNQLRLMDAEVAHMLGQTARARRELEEMTAEFRGTNETSMANLAQDALIRIERETRTAFVNRTVSQEIQLGDPDVDTVETGKLD